jgi:hypothetical protein
MLDPSVSVLVPYRPDGGYREQAWEHLLGPSWAASGAEVIVESPGDGAHPGEFNHPLAINTAAAKASGDVFLIADADTYWTKGLPELLVEAVRGGAPWAMPRHYAKLTVTQSRSLVKGRPSQSVAGLHARAHWVGDSVSWSGLVCVPQAAFHEVGGYDERWEFWGADDVAFGLSLDTLVGEHVRIEGSCLHLWHPEPLGQTYGHSRHREQYALGERYKAAAGDAAAMREVRFGVPSC